MNKSTFVLLRRDWPGEFRRTMRDASQKPLRDAEGNERVLVFSPGQVVELDAEQLEAVRNDIGISLQLAKVTGEKGKEVVLAKCDDDTTKSFMEETKKLRERQRASRKAGAKPAEKVAPAAKSDGKPEGK